MIDPLENRRLLAAQFSLTAPTTLLVEGTTGDDVIGLSARGEQLRVVINGVLQRFVLANVTRIEIQALEGNDIAGWGGISIPTYINAGAGNDSAVGGLGNDSLTGASGKDTLRGGPGNDRIDGANSPDICYGDDGSDVVYGSAHDDYLDGGTGIDWLFGGDGMDRLLGGTHNDRLYGGESGDRIYGLEGNDLLNGEGGNDRLFGGVGNDQIYGGAGADQLYGEIGDDGLFDKDSTADLIDGGDGTDSAEVDGSLDSVSNAEDVVGTTPPITATHKVAISFNDEALWSANFNTAVAQAKALGVTAVRLWLSVSSFSERPNAWDDVQEEEVVKSWVLPTSDRAVIGGLAMKRAFDLKKAGFSVTFTVNNWSGDAPTSAAEVKGLYTHLMNSTETPTSTKKIRDVVDYWEVGQEVDSASNWKPVATNKTTGLQSYVDQLLIPAADVLHSGTPSQWEKVISASVRWNPADLNIILKQLNTRNRLDAIDFAGFHPYGTYDPSNPAITNEIDLRTKQAVAFGKTYDKKLIATEWNVRGFPVDGSRNATWAQAINDIHNNTILPNYEIGFYYALVNNYAGRGGGTTARPAGLLKHNTNMVVSPTSSISDLVTYFNTPLVKSDPFYTTIDSWTA